MELGRSWFVLVPKYNLFVTLPIMQQECKILCATTLYKFLRIDPTVGYINITPTALINSSPLEEFVVEVPRRGVLNNPIFLQVLVEGVYLIRCDTFRILREAVVRADREEEVAFRAHAHFELEPQSWRSSLRRKYL